MRRVPRVGVPARHRIRRVAFGGGWIRPEPL